jgi:lysozyme
MKASQNCINLVKKFESLHDGDLNVIGLQPKMCPAGIWTEGYGHAMTFKGAFIQGLYNERFAFSLRKVKTEADALQLLKADIIEFENHVNDIVTSSINQYQFDALVSLCFNIGPHNMSTSTIIKKVNANPNDPTIRQEFNKWVYAAGRRLAGLENRRNAEANLYFS